MKNNLPPQPTYLKPSGSSFSKWKLPISVLLVVITGITVWYFLPKNIEQSRHLSQEISTTDWKIFTNTKYGYSIKYPENSVVVHSLCGGMGSTHVDPAEICNQVEVDLGIPLYWGILFNIDDNNQNLEPNIYLQKMLSKSTLNQKILKKDFNGKNGAIANFKGVLMYPIDTQGGDYHDEERGIIVVILDNSKILRVTYPIEYCFEVKYDESYKTEMQFKVPCYSDGKTDLLKQIVDTLKISNVATPTISWDTQF